MCRGIGKKMETTLVVGVQGFGELGLYSEYIGTRRGMEKKIETTMLLGFKVLSN